MDVYHKVLVRLYEATGGKESEAVDLKELAKKAGFLPSFPQIKEHLSRESWITETSRADVVKITHWGIKAAKAAQTDGGDASQALKKEANQLLSESRELLAIVEVIAGEVTKEDLAKAEKKVADIAAALSKLKSGV